MILNFLLICFFAGIAIAQERRMETSAFDKKSNRLVYVEDRIESNTGPKPITWQFTYRDDKNRTIVKRVVNFKTDILKPNFLLEDLRNGYSEGAEYVNGRLKVFRGGTAQEPFREKFIDVPEPAVVDAGFNFFVEQNWDAIQKGDIKSFHFVAPSQLDYFSFRVIKDKDIEIGGRDAVIIRLELDNFLFRIFVDPIVLVYDKNSKRLISYEGISNIYNDDGKSYVVRMNFKL